MECLSRLEKRRKLEWERLENMNPGIGELHRLRLHLQWLRLSDEARLRTEYLPGMGRRRGDHDGDD